jgi:hypothetical protein
LGNSLADVKAQARRDLHAQAAVPATYIDDTLIETVPTAVQTAAGSTLTVRWHSRLSRAGAREGGFDVEIVEGIERLVFSQDELDALGLTLRRKGVVTLTDYGMDFELDHEERPDGPVTVYWSVVKL